MKQLTSGILALIAAIMCAGPVVAGEVDCSEKCWILSFEAREMGGSISGGITLTASETFSTHPVLHVERFTSKAAASKRLANLSAGWMLVPGSIAVYQATQEKVVTKETATRIPQPDLVRTETAYCLDPSDCEADQVATTAISAIVRGNASTSMLTWNGSDAPKKNTSKQRTKTSAR